MNAEDYPSLPQIPKCFFTWYTLSKLLRIACHAWFCLFVILSLFFVKQVCILFTQYILKHVIIDSRCCFLSIVYLVVSDSVVLSLSPPTQPVSPTASCCVGCHLCPTQPSSNSKGKAAHVLFCPQNSQINKNSTI